MKKIKEFKIFKKEMHEYIDNYNNKGINTKLKGLTPTLYRHQSLNLEILN